MDKHSNRFEFTWSLPAMFTLQEFSQLFFRATFVGLRCDLKARHGPFSDDSYYANIYTVTKSGITFKYQRLDLCFLGLPMLPKCAGAGLSPTNVS